MWKETPISWESPWLFHCFIPSLTFWHSKTVNMISKIIYYLFIFLFWEAFLNKLLLLCRHTVLEQKQIHGRTFSKISCCEFLLSASCLPLPSGQRHLMDDSCKLWSRLLHWVLENRESNAHWGIYAHLKIDTNI